MRLNPFNPQQPARPNFFVGREPELTEYEKLLFQTMNSSPMNMSITGNRGMGKTSVLIKFEELAKTNNCLVLRLSNYEGNFKDIVGLANFIVTNLKGELLSKKPLEKAKEWLLQFKPTIEWKGFNVSIEKKQVIQEMFRRKLKEIWDESKEEYKAIVILIDEAEAIERIDGALTFLREVFQRLSSEADYMVILAGKLNFPERMSEEFSPLNRFFPAQKLEPFSFDDIKKYISERLSVVNVTIDQEAIKYLAKKCEGHPYVLVSMGFNLFDSLNDKETHITMDIIKRAEPKIYSKLEQDFFSSMYHPLSKRGKEILSMVVNNIKGLDFTFKDAVEWTDNIDGSYVSPHILEFMRKGIVNRPERAQYKFFHSLFLEYIKKQEAEII